MLKNNPAEDVSKRKNNLEDLNLYNFDDQKASESPYILTSPRSLKACLLANVKPIELLHRSVADIAADLNLPESRVKHIYIDYEHERLRKLEICKLIRKHMLLYGSYDNQKFISGLCEGISKEEIKRTPSYINRGVRTEIRKRSQSYSPCSSPITPISQYNSVRRQSNKLLHYGLSSSSNPSPVNNRKYDSYKIRSKSAEAKHYKNMHHKKSVEKNTSNVKRVCEKQESSRRCHATANQINDQQLCWQIDKVKSENKCNKKNRFNQRTKKMSKINRKCNTEKDKHCEENHFISNCEKVINVKPEPQNILDTAKCDVIGTITRKSNRECNAKYLTDTYNETVKNDRKQMDATRNKTDQNKNNLESVKNHDVRILDAMATKREFQQSQDNLARNADLIWTTFDENLSKEKYLKYKNKGNRNLKTAKVDCCLCKENISFDTYFQQIRNRIKQLKENSLYKELHSEHVRQLARELQIGMEQWQDQVLLLQWQALQRARTNAKLYLENRRLKTQSENNERVLLHALRFRNVQDMERIKQQIMKKEIKEKDSRIERLKLKREREIMDCRAQAQYTAELREQLRRTLTPETFDRKVNDVLIKSKFINRSLTSSPFTESHIRLG